jgi:hypothetical protein
LYSQLLKCSEKFQEDGYIRFENNLYHYKFTTIIVIRKSISVDQFALSPHLRTHRPRIRPHPLPHLLYKIRGLARASGSRSGFRRPAIWALRFPLSSENGAKHTVPKKLQFTSLITTATNDIAYFARKFKFKMCIVN